jgi:hypothetical protein
MKTTRITIRGLRPAEGLPLAIEVDSDQEIRYAEITYQGEAAKVELTFEALLPDEPKGDA